jgi:ribokinase
VSGDATAQRVLVVGSANVDFTVAAPRLPAVGETVSGGTLLVNHGGKGANQAVAASRLGAEVRFVGCVGDDGSGREIRAALEAERIGVDGVGVTREAATGTALIVVDGEGRNQIAVAPGANWRLALEHVRSRKDDFAWAHVVLCQLETPLETVAWTLEEARRRGAVTVLNPAPVREGLADLWRFVDYLTPNEGEAERLTGIAVRDLRSAAAAGHARRRHRDRDARRRRRPGLHRRGGRGEGDASSGARRDGGGYDGRGRRVQRRPCRSARWNAETRGRASIRQRGRRARVHPSGRAAVAADPRRG